MAVIARAEVTLSVAVDVASVDTWYILQPSTSPAPAKPETASPEGWLESEPSYDGSMTNTLYTCQVTTLTDGTFYWGSVSRSSSYEAAKQAANAADAAGTAAGDAQIAAGEAAEAAMEAQEDATRAISDVLQAAEVAQSALEIAGASGQHFWTDAAGAHVTEVAREAWEEEPAGANALFNSSGALLRKGTGNILAIEAGNVPGVAIYDGEGNEAGNVIASFSSNGIQLGSSESDAFLTATQERISFWEDGAEVAYASGGEFSAPNMTVDSQLSLISAEGGWAWVPRSNGNLALKWIG